MFVVLINDNGCGIILYSACSYSGYIDVLWQFDGRFLWDLTGYISIIFQNFAVIIETAVSF